MIKQLNQQVDLKLLIKTISGVVLIALAITGGYFVFQEVQKSVWYKKYALWRYLKKNSSSRDFTATNYDFNIKSTIEKIKAEISSTTNQINLTTTNIALLQKQLADLRKEHEQIQNKIGSSKSRATYLEEELLSNQRRLTNQLLEIETARSNANFRLKVVEDLRVQIKTLQDKYNSLTNEIATSKTNLAQLKGKQNFSRTNYANLSSEVKNKIKSIDSDRAYIEKLNKRLKEIDDQILKNQKEIDALVKQKETMTDSKNLQEIEANISKLRKNAETLQSERSENNEKLRSMQVVISETEQAITKSTNSLAKLQTEIDELQKEIDALSRAISQKENEASDLRRQISNLASTLSDRESSLKNYSNTLAQLETNLFNRQTNIAFIKTNAMEKRKEMLKAGEELTINEKLQAKTRDEIQKANDRLNELRKKLTTLQRELSQKEAEAANQYRYFARDVASRINAAQSYAAIYHIIGQELWVTERLLKLAEIEKRIEAVKIAFDAMRHALDPAQNYWLACRITEVYLFPNINLLKGSDSDRQVLDQIFSYAVNAFQNNEEDENVIRAYELHLANTADERRANTVRYYLSLQHEQKGELEKAVWYLKQITDKTNFAYAVNRIPSLEAKIERLKKK